VKRYIEIEIVCATCKKFFVGKLRSKYCSAKCRRDRERSLYAKPYVPEPAKKVSCKRCSKVFMVKGVKDRGRRYCSAECRRTVQYARVNARRRHPYIKRYAKCKGCRDTFFSTHPLHVQCAACRKLARQLASRKYALKTSGQRRKSVCLKACAVCGQPFSTTEKSRKKYCSTLCHRSNFCNRDPEQLALEELEKECLTCKKRFIATGRNRFIRKFCSEDCTAKYAKASERIRSVGWPDGLDIPVKLVRSRCAVARVKNLIRALA
jgi:hypothetical protein